MNNAGYPIGFFLEVFDVDQLKWLTIDGIDSGSNDGQTISIDLSTIPGLSEGRNIRPLIRGTWNLNASPDQFVQYAKNAQTATYVVTGTAFETKVQMT